MKTHARVAMGCNIRNEEMKRMSGEKKTKKKKTEEGEKKGEEKVGESREKVGEKVELARRNLNSNFERRGYEFS